MHWTSILVTHYLEHSDLPESDLLHSLVLVCLQKLLDGNKLSRVLVPALHHHAIGSLTNVPKVVILLHNYCQLIYKSVEELITNCRRHA